jgi:hypothetical protein
LEVKITEDHIKKAKKMAEEMGKLKNSITKGDGNLAGFIGEIIVAELAGAKHKNTYDYDMVLSDGKTVDVKTKRTTVEPKEYYESSVAAFNTKQECDYYAFVRVHTDLTKAWFLGIISKDVYYMKAHFLRKGEFDNSNNYEVKADCYNMKYHDIWKEFEREFG